MANVWKVHCEHPEGETASMIAAGLEFLEPRSCHESISSGASLSRYCICISQLHVRRNPLGLELAGESVSSQKQAVVASCELFDWDCGW